MKKLIFIALLATLVFMGCQVETTQMVIQPEVEPTAYEIPELNPADYPDPTSVTELEGSLPLDTLAGNRYTVSDWGINTKWQQLGGASGFLGNPTTNTGTVTGGKYNGFEGGSIHRKSNYTYGYETHGNIRWRWSWTGWETGPMGWPGSDEGRYTTANNESWYWSRFETGWLFCEYYNSTFGWVTFPIFDRLNYSANSSRPTLSAWVNGNQLGAHFGYSGSRFTPNAEVTIYYCNPKSGLVKIDTDYADSNGNISGNTDKSWLYNDYIRHADLQKYNNYFSFMAVEYASPHLVAFDADYESYYGTNYSF